MFSHQLSPIGTAGMLVAVYTVLYSTREHPVHYPVEFDNTHFKLLNNHIQKQHLNHPIYFYLEFFESLICIPCQKLSNRCHHYHMAYSVVYKDVTSFKKLTRYHTCKF